MLYLILEILLFLLLAAACGFVAGWFLKGAGRKREISQLEKIWKANLYSKEQEIRAGREEIDRLYADLHACRESLHALSTSAEQSAAAAKTEPAGTTGIQEDERDNLKKIRGIGKALEKALNREGIYRFSQVAHLDDAALAALKEKIGTLRNRIRRDEWVAGARAEYYKKYGEEL